MSSFLFSNYQEEIPCKQNCLWDSGIDSNYKPDKSSKLKLKNYKIKKHKYDLKIFLSCHFMEE
jgi:hypothetical protein